MLYVFRYLETHVRKDGQAANAVCSSCCEQATAKCARETKREPRHTLASLEHPNSTCDGTSARNLHPVDRKEKRPKKRRVAQAQRAPTNYLRETERKWPVNLS